MTLAEEYSEYRLDNRNKPAAMCYYPEQEADWADLQYLHKAKFHPDGITVTMTDNSIAIRDGVWKFAWRTN